MQRGEMNPQAAGTVMFVGVLTITMVHRAGHACTSALPRVLTLPLQLFYHFNHLYAYHRYRFNYPEDNAVTLLVHRTVGLICFKDTVLLCNGAGEAPPSLEMSQC